MCVLLETLFLFGTRACANCPLILNGEINANLLRDREILVKEKRASVQESDMFSLSSIRKATSFSTVCLNNYATGKQHSKGNAQLLPYLLTITFLRNERLFFVTSHLRSIN